MTNLEPTPARQRLAAALDGLAHTFRGMTAHPDENNCECHWGSAEELALLKVPDVELDPDLLRRTWSAPDWDDHPAVLRRILPQFARALAGDLAGLDAYFLTDVGFSFARGGWQRWPTEQAGAVWEFLHAWWAHTLVDPAPAGSAYDVFEVLAEATAGRLRPWLGDWEALDGHPVADQRLTEAVAHWVGDLLGDSLPWFAAGNDDGTRVELVTWLVRHAPARLRSQGGSEELVYRVELLTVESAARWEDPRCWPDRGR
ncbi:hypothetical protein ACFP2T_10605 [Plantactinospora solaniradicis]|uniref:Uncharacterized protein n=1 Tax=Plantactinospora solaniradicis TaxID=1723736 RepID=A0ABW1K632_9ACTN